MVHGEYGTGNQFSVPRAQFSELRMGWQLRTDFLVCCPEMWGTSRWIARLLVVVTLVSSVGPLTMACAFQGQAMQCARHAMSGNVTAHGTEAEMPCHHAMAHRKAAESEAAETALRASDSDCCQNHCCCGATTSEWAQPAANPFSTLSLLIEAARPSQSTVLRSSDIPGQDSARAPPRS